MQRVLNGVDDLRAVSRELRGLRVGLITNHTGLTRDLVPTSLALQRVAGLSLVRLFAPEHGIWGEAQAGDAVADAPDPLTGLPVVSLFGERQAPPADSLRGLDALVFDIQDIGARYYTFIWTMAKCMEAACRHGLKFVVLDRPNPITGVTVEGNLSRREFASFIGLHPLAVRHGMTAGEIARYLAGEFGIAPEPTVIRSAGWRRSMWWEDTGLTFVPPSPNSTGVDMALLYPGTCLLEGTNLSEGRGTTKPFEIAGAPWIDPFRFASELNASGPQGVLFRPLFFVPVKAGRPPALHGGAQAHIRNRGVVRAFELGLQILCTARRLYREFEWRKRADGLAIDRLAGTDELRLMIDGGATPRAILAHFEAGRRRFLRARGKYLLYGEG